ncbi:MAG: hypothetical protein PUQ00_02500 [Nostoc sp. S13]|nr:hypothetical protein [Nostoc sp. S13]
MGHRAWGRSYLFGPCPMPQGLGRLSLSTHVRAASRREGMEFPAAFNE